MLKFPRRPPELVGLPGMDCQPQCMRCGYPLDALATPACPECGKCFDPQNPATFSWKPPLNRWRYWLPAALLAVGGSGLIFLALAWSGETGWGMMLALPLCIGGALGYGVRPQRPLGWMIATILVGSTLTGVALAGPYGLVCTVIAAVAIVGPILVGTLFGVILRWMLKRTDFSQRRHLSVITLLLLIPPLVCALESIGRRAHGQETVTSTRLIAARPQTVWDALCFFEQIEGERPALLRRALPRPVAVYGMARAVGDVSVCVYTQGRITKKITACRSGETLAFEVVDQTGFEERSVRLAGGSFNLESVGQDATRLTLRTTYTPLLDARAIWRPFERAVARALHEHVLDAVAAGADGRVMAQAGIVRP